MTEEEKQQIYKRFLIDTTGPWIVETQADRTNFHMYDLALSDPVVESRAVITGRSSATSPNMQSIPTRGRLYGRVRKPGIYRIV